MKLKTSIILLVAITSAPAFANPIWDIYAGATIGVGAQTVFYDNDSQTNSAQSFGALFGVDIPVLRIEAEYNYLNESETHAHVALLNAYFKMPSTVIKPYLGVGAGVMFDGKNDEYNVKFDSTAAYQGMLGITVDVPVLPVKFDIEGRALYVPDVAKVGALKPDVLHYDARLKIRYVF